MPRPKKPAILKHGKSESKEHLEARSILEEEIRGGKDLIYGYIPDSLDDVGKQYYKFILKELKVVDITSNLDIPLLTQMCEALSKMDMMTEELSNKGVIIQKETKTGLQPMENPAVKTYAMYQGIFMKISTQFGLSPSSRSQLAEMNMSKQADEDDPLAKALQDI